MIDSGAGTAENYPVFSVAGGRARNQTFILDGGNVSNAVGLTRPQQLTSLPVDAMQEFRVIANNYSAEYGHSTGGIVTMSTRAGHQRISRQPVRIAAEQRLRRAQFLRRSQAADPPEPVRRRLRRPDPQGQDALLRHLGTDAAAHQHADRPPCPPSPTARAISPVCATPEPVIYDPATTVGRDRQPFAGNVIPAYRFDPVARAALNYYPLPNQRRHRHQRQQLRRQQRPVAQPQHRRRRASITSSATRDQATARYYINDSGTDNTGTYGNPGVRPRRRSSPTSACRASCGAHTHIFRPTLVNELRVTYLRRKFIDTRPGNGDNLAAAIGLTGVSDAAFPAFTIPGLRARSAIPPRSSRASRRRSLDRQILDSLSWFRGKHALKFGAEFRARRQRPRSRDRGSSGNFTISPLITGLPGVSGTGNALASFLLGEVNAASIQISDKIPSRASYWALYAQDDWRITDRLTMNLGLRWEVGAAAPRGRQPDELVRPAGHQSRLRHARRGHLRRT